MEFLLVILYAAIFIFIIHKLKFFSIDGLSKKLIYGIFILKILCGYILALIYTYYYPDRATADIYKYFDDSKVMYDALFKHPPDYLQMLFGIRNDTEYFDINYFQKMLHWYREYESNLYNDSHTIIRFNAAVRLFSFGYYNVHTVFMCFLSLVGLIGIYKTFRPLIADKQKELFIAVFLIPSVLFWGSGVLKEGLLLFGLGLIIYFFHQILAKKFSFWGVFWIIFSLVLLNYLKFYALVAIIPGLLANLLIALTNRKYIFLKYLFSLLFVGLLCLNIHYIFPQWNFLEILTLKQKDFIGLAKSLDSGSYIELNKLEPNLLGLIKNTPQALFNTFLRPHFGDIRSIFHAIAGIENLLILLIGALSLICIGRGNLQKIDYQMLFFCLSFVFILFITIGLTTPVIGAIVRYKVPALPFLLISFLLIVDKPKKCNREKIMI